MQTRDSIRCLVRLLVRWSISPCSLSRKRGNRKIKCFRYFLGMFVCGIEGWSGDGGWTPLPTHPQLYCDLASLVSLVHQPIRRSFHRSGIRVETCKNAHSLCRSCNCLCVCGVGEVARVWMRVVRPCLQVKKGAIYLPS